MQSPQGEPVLFYEKGQPYFGFTNFSPYPVEFEGKSYPTSEHLFQAHKFLDARPDLAERIRNAPSARAAREEATKLRQYQRGDWFNVNLGLMEQVLETKFTKHAVLRDMLLSTGDVDIVQNSPDDGFWGCGGDHQGRNELGKALMRVRTRLRNNATTQPAVASFSSQVQAQKIPQLVSMPGSMPGSMPDPTSPTSPSAVPAPGGGKAGRPLPVPKPVTRGPSNTGNVNPPAARRVDISSNLPIFFFDRDDPYSEFMNNSPHTVSFQGKVYPTAEHLFQAHKFLSNAPHLAEHIRTQTSSRAAWEQAALLRLHQRNDWFDVNIQCMDIVLKTKFAQYENLRQLLMSTGERELINANPVDTFWGCGTNDQGRNELGKALTRLRTTIRDEDEDDRTTVGDDLDIGNL
ncbi:NADAR family protein [Phanerochaete sordida]|uniref:NADAR family protein n=1 Tax=Phanerochaete sordida TaxID=48140 RepID=A0A9P3LIK1_9APHY|nr:NADAR family protein [Phanerochaete sordida]